MNQNPRSSSRPSSPTDRSTDVLDLLRRRQAIDRNALPPTRPPTPASIATVPVRAAVTFTRAGTRSTNSDSSQYMLVGRSSSPLDEAQSEQSQHGPSHARKSIDQISMTLSEADAAYRLNRDLIAGAKRLAKESSKHMVQVLVWECKFLSGYVRERVAKRKKMFAPPQRIVTTVDRSGVQIYDETHLST